MTEPVTPRSSSEKRSKKKATLSSSPKQSTDQSPAARSASTKPPVTKPAPYVVVKAESRPSSPSSSSATQKREPARQPREAEVAFQRSKAQRQKRKRQRASNRGLWLSIGGTVVAVAAVIILFILLGRSGASPSGAYPVTAIDPTVLKQITTVDPSVLASVGTGQGQTKPTKLSGASPLTGPSGKPEVFYYGAEYCPYCAAERWALIVALSRFGTFGNLHQTTSSSTDVYPSTNTFSFYQSSYTSQYLDFVPLEVEGYQGVSLQTPTSAEQQVVNQYNAGGSFPFVDVANQYTVVGASYSPQVLANMTWQQIASSLSDAQSSVAQNILGAANYLTAAMCQATSEQPASVCQAVPIPQVQQALGSSTGNTGTPGSLLSTPAAAFRASAIER
jgi:hypothetical protein